MPALFQYCPRCGREGFRTTDGKAYSCAGCDFLYFVNPACAVGAFIADEAGRVLWLRRVRAPRRGALTIPGGFIDPGESAEDALRREVLEETNLELATLAYLSSHPNIYPYRGVDYRVLDIFFTATVTSFAPLRLEADEVERCVFLPWSQIDPEELAFDSVRAALQRLAACKEFSPDPPK